MQETSAAAFLCGDAAHPSSAAAAGDEPKAFRCSEEDAGQGEQHCSAAGDEQAVLRQAG